MCPTLLPPKQEWTLVIRCAVCWCSLGAVASWHVADRAATAVTGTGLLGLIRKDHGATCTLKGLTGSYSHAAHMHYNLHGWWAPPTLDTHLPELGCTHHMVAATSSCTKTPRAVHKFVQYFKVLALTVRTQNNPLQSMTVTGLLSCRSRAQAVLQAVPCPKVTTSKQDTVL